MTREERSAAVDAVLILSVAALGAYGLYLASSYVFGELGRSIGSGISFQPASGGSSAASGALSNSEATPARKMG